MAILSDIEIQNQMHVGALVLGGNTNRAEHCSYSFVPGRVFRAGSHEPPIDFPGDQGRSEVLVGPGEMIWIRTAETVKIPHELAAFWWQTNTLSRKGLMLVNMSMVEPGYEGPLACLFVNFGKSYIRIGPDTVIAKMVFEKISGKVGRPFDKVFGLAEYDSALREQAIHQPPSFLQVSDLVIDLQNQRKEALEKIDKGREEALSSVVAAVEKAKATATEAFETDTKKTITKALGWAAPAVVLLTIVTLAANVIKERLGPDAKSIARAEAERVLNERVIVSGAPDPIVNARLQKRLDDIDNRVARLEPKK